ncbi:unnamed protein product [Danaus chrysippus]|uniref:Galactosylgalactosylxylosylprotein 3-beta-glucuronosyltransferase n=1 Tax=Danaus chrysippus TaxID=151541 RepID=A0A8J2PZS6_9NEOP|nr:unnamed protein product [Danaus chrysippus]
MVVFVTVLWLLFSWGNVGILSLHANDPRSIPVAVRNKLCSVKMTDERSHLPSSGRMIYYVTPTYPRPEQVPELTRLAHTLMHVPRLHWIVADDQPVCSELVEDILKRTGLPFTHISSPKPFIYKSSNFPRGVSNRRAALDWLHENVSEGVLYFGDDDNTVDLRLFDEIRSTEKVSMFPVGLIGDYGVSSPVVKDGKVVGFYDSWPGARSFPVDMAGFAVNMAMLREGATMPFVAGHEEDGFLRSLSVELTDIQPLAENCTKILVWHTKTVKHKKPTVRVDLDKLKNSGRYHNLASLLRETSYMGMAEVSADSGIKSFITSNRKTFQALTDL